MKAKTIKWDGRQITKPGLYSGIPLELYHDPYICAGDVRIPNPVEGGPTTFGPSASSSTLREIYGEGKSPRQFYATWRGNPNRIIVPDHKKRHFVIGRALHHIVLGEKFFAKNFCIQPDEWPDEHGVLRPWNNNRTVCREWTIKHLRQGRTPLAMKEAEAIKQMAISLGNHPLVQHGALNGAVERSLFWRDKETGLWLKARPDVIPLDSADYTDIKTTRSTASAAISDSLNKFGYYRQVALVAEASRVVLDMPMETFTLVFVEKQPAWHTRDIRVPDEDVQIGARENRAALRTFARCLRENRWPGPGDGNEGNERIGLSQAARERRNQALQYEGLADGND